MCTDVNTACAPWFNLLSESEKQFLNCSQLDTDGSLKFSDDTQNCYIFDNKGTSYLFFKKLLIFVSMK